MTDDLLFSHTDTCGACGDERRVVVTPTGRKRCVECYPGVENPWDWGVVLSKRGRVLEPGGCDDYHNKDYQRDLLHD